MEFGVSSIGVVMEDCMEGCVEPAMAESMTEG
jgi:hypothetical protein